MGGLRHKVAWWFGRGRHDPAKLQLLDRTREELAAAVASDLKALQKELARDWLVRFMDLARSHPDAADELEALVREIQALVPARPVVTGGHSVAAGRDMTISAAGGGLAAGVIYGNVASPGPTRPGPAG